MLINGSVVYLLIFGASTLLIVIVVLLFLYLHSLSEYIGLKRLLMRNKTESVYEAQKVIDDATVEAQKILKETQFKVDEIIKSSEVFRGESSNFVNMEVRKITEFQTASYQRIIQDLQGKLEKAFVNLSADVNSKIDKEIALFSNALQKQAVSIGSISSDVVQKLQKDLVNDIERYKEEKYKQVEDRILDVVKDLSAKVISRDISIDEHEKMIKKFVNDAKNGGLI